MTPQRISDAIHEGVELSAMLVALGYEACQGRPGRFLLNNALELRGYGRPIPAPPPSQPANGFSLDWMPIIAQAVTGRSDASANEVAATLWKTPRAL